MAAETSTGSEHLIIQTAFLGDLLLGIPLLKQLRALKPHDKLTLLCRRGLGDFMLQTGLVDDVVEADKSVPESWREAVADLKSRRFDWLLSPHQSPRSTWLARSLVAQRKVGYRHPLAVFAFDERIQRPMELPEALRQLALLEPIDPQWKKRLDEFASRQKASGGQGDKGELLNVPSWAAMNIPPLDELRSLFRASRSLSLLRPKVAEIVEAWRDERPLVVLAPGSVWPTKKWTRTGFIQVARAFVDKGYRVLLLGARDEAELCESMAGEIPGVEVVAGRTSLFESAQILALADLFIGNDSGAMHLASIVGVPTVAIFGPTVLEFGYRPWQNRARVVQVPREEMKCRPCGKHGAKTCPIGTHACMKNIEVSSVVAAAMEVMDL